MGIPSLFLEALQLLLVLLMYPFNGAGLVAKTIGMARTQTRSRAGVVAWAQSGR